MSFVTFVLDALPEKANHFTSEPQHPGEFNFSEFWVGRKGTCLLTLTVRHNNVFIFRSLPVQNFIEYPLPPSRRKQRVIYEIEADVNSRDGNV